LGEHPALGSLKSLAEGFLLGAGLIWMFNIASLFRSGDAWLAFLYLMILSIPASTLLYFRTKKKDAPLTEDVWEKWRKLLFSVQGVALAFWCFDILTTFYAINVTGLAVELNPLGWPAGILGAFSYYAPTLVFSYYLLFRSRVTVSFYAAVGLTLLTLVMGSMNLLAGVQNFQVFVNTAMLATGVRFGLLAVVGTACLAVPLLLKNTSTQPKPLMN